MTIGEYIARNPEIEITKDEIEACLYLQNRGFLFMVHFGIGNCIAMRDRLRAGERGIAPPPGILNLTDFDRRFLKSLKVAI